jgi:hypothetical protein
VALAELFDGAGLVAFVSAGTAEAVASTSGLVVSTGCAADGSEVVAGVSGWEGVLDSEGFAVAGGAV